MMRLQDKTALITGGARGIGATTALLFAKEGARVGIVDLQEEGLNEVSGKAKSQGLEIETFAGDITQKDAVNRLLNQFVQKLGRIDILVNNAGVLIPRHICWSKNPVKLSIFLRSAAFIIAGAKA
jgi:3-oxoacyl-[acyl-carrier protein] reductase